MSQNSFQTESSFISNKKTYTFYDLNRIHPKNKIEKLPYSLKILLENLLRLEDNKAVFKKDIQALLDFNAHTPSKDEIAFTPARVVLQDFTGVPVMVDLAAMRLAMANLKKNPRKINPLSPVELVIDHSVIVDYFGNNKAFNKNVEREIARNLERYAFLRWGQTAFQNFKVVPPGTGIVHQVNLEYLARVVFAEEKQGKMLAFPDTLVGTDSHTTMINGLGVLGWGVGGIEAEAAMLGQPISLLIPEVVGFKLTGSLREPATATDLVLTVVEMLRKKKVVGKFVEFYGEGLSTLSIADRGTIANMSPEFGATCGMFPIDAATLEYLHLTGRTEEQIRLVEDYAKAQGIFYTKASPDAEYSDHLHLNLEEVAPCIAGPKRPQDRILLNTSQEKFKQVLEENKVAIDQAKTDRLSQGSVVIAAISSCTNTSNPEVMIAAGLVAKKAVALGLESKPWVKTSLAPGSQVVSDYFDKAGLTEPLEKLGFYLVGYGCTTCIGNSGPLPQEISQKIKEENLQVAAVISSNRNFEGRIHPEVRFAYLMSPPLVVIYALAGTMYIDLYKDPIGHTKAGKAVYLKDVWPTEQEIKEVMQSSLQGSMFTSRYGSVFDGNEQWKNLIATESELFSWDEDSTYIKNPPYFENFSLEIMQTPEIKQARVLALLGDSVTTDHISPAGDIDPKSPAGQYLLSHGIEQQNFNSYGSRRGNHEVMIRGTFANIRLKNHLVLEKEGNWTKHFPSGEILSIFDACQRYQKENVSLIIIAGKEYGTGSSRDWAAKGAKLLGVRAVIAESFERIHRSNLIGMGVLPLEFLPNENATSLKLTGEEKYSIAISALQPNQEIKVLVENADASIGTVAEFKVQLRIDTPKELEYYQHGGILPFVLRNIASQVA